MIEQIRQEPLLYNDDVIEISRRIKSRQRENYGFLRSLTKLAGKSTDASYDSPSEVRINLVGRTDNLNSNRSSQTKGLGSSALTQLFKLETLSSCNQYSTLSLGRPQINQLGGQWQAIEMPIIRSSYSFINERLAVANQINKTLRSDKIVWTPQEPLLQVVEFKGDIELAEKFLDVVLREAPDQTEVFDASVRFREPLFGHDNC